MLSDDTIIQMRFTFLGRVLIYIGNGLDFFLRVTKLTGKEKWLNPVLLLWAKALKSQIRVIK